MASVSTKGSRQWHASIRQWKADNTPEGGRWVRTWQQTGVPATAPKSQAMAVAEKWQAAADKAGPDNPRRTDQRVFAEALMDLWKAAGLDAPEATLTWRELVPQYVDSTTAAEASKGIYRARLDAFTEFLGPKAGQLLHNVAQSDCQAFYGSLISRGLSAKTARDYLKLVNGAFELARHRHVISVNPAGLVRTPVGKSGMRQAMSLDEVRQILATLETEQARYLANTRQEWRTVILFGLWCGMRLGDATRRKWSDFSDDLSTVTFIPEKKSRKGVPVTLPVVGALRDHLISLPHTGDYLTPHLAKTNKASEPFGKLLDAAGISAERPEKAGEKSKPKRFKSFHSLRHTVITEMAKSGADRQLRQLLADHDDPRMSTLYTHAAVERLAVALTDALGA